MSEDSLIYDSYKEERDLILEYNQAAEEDYRVVNIQGLGIHNLTRVQAVARIMKMIEAGGTHHIISVNPYKIQRIKSNNDLSIISNRADMHLAAGAGVEWAAKRLGTPIQERIGSLSLMMDLIRLAEVKEYTIFLVGGRPEVVEKAYTNIRKSFPNIRIVGRHGGFFSADRELSVIEAMRKSEANIIFVGLGYPREDKWIYKIRNEFSNTVFISVGGNLDIISGTARKAPPFIVDRGLEWFYRIITRPWRVGRMARTKIFFISVFFKGLFKKK